MSPPTTGVVLGLLAGCGLVVAVAWTPLVRRPTLADRIAPHLRDTPRPSRLLVTQRTVTPFPTIERLARPLLEELSRVLDRVVGGVISARRRLDRLGADMTLEEFRAQQLIWAAGALVVALALSGLLLAKGAVASPLALLIFCGIAAVGGVVARDRWLTVEVRRREDAMLAEFPTVAELLALAVAAGEAPARALERVVNVSDGELARELHRVIADAHAGASLVDALEALARRTALQPVARFVDGLAIALERGTPLVDVLRAQAVDVREERKRWLLESGGRREIAMMVPVVFLVLPVVVLFGLFPGFYGLSLAAP